MFLKLFVLFLSVLQVSDIKAIKTYQGSIQIAIFGYFYIAEFTSLIAGGGLERNPSDWRHGCLTSCILGERQRV